MTYPAGRLRTLLAAALLLVATLISSAGLVAENLRLYRTLPPLDPVTIHEQRISQLRPYLPERGAVGYATTVENEAIFAAERTFRDVEYVAQYCLTQYTLAPLFVENTTDRRLVIGNFLSGPPPAGFAERKGLTTLKDFGEGLVLFAGGKKP